VLAAVNDKPYGGPKRGRHWPPLRAMARQGCGHGRKNACGAVEKRNGIKQEYQVGGAIKRTEECLRRGRTKKWAAQETAWRSDWK
jgi:hypothetical protein